MFIMKTLAGKKSLALILLVIAMPLLLAACGDQNTAQTDNNFTVPPYQGTEAITDLASNQTFKNLVLEPTNQSYSNPSVEAYKTKSTLTDTKNWYQAQLEKLGWVNHTAGIIKSDGLKNGDTENGWVLAYVKQDHLVGVMMFNPSAQKQGIFNNPDIKGLVPTDGQNLLIITQAIYRTGQATSTTPTPAPTK